MAIYFRLQAHHEDGSRYYEDHIDVFQLQDTLDQLQDTYEQFFSGNDHPYTRADVVNMDSLHIETINSDGDCIEFK